LKLINSLIFVMAGLMFFTGNSLQSKSLDSNLKVLKPFLNKHWIGMLKSPDGSREFKVIRKYESILDGKVIKSIKENEELKNYGEGYFYWDDLKKKIAFFFIENSRVFLIGEVTIKENMIIINGKLTWPEKQRPPVNQSFEFKNTFELTEDGKMIDRWFHNAFGQWRSGHVIEFCPGNKNKS